MNQPRTLSLPGNALRLPQGVRLFGTVEDRFGRVLTPEALEFATHLERRFRTRRDALIAWRERRAGATAAGRLPRFLPETTAIRQSDWAVAPLPNDLLDRRVELVVAPSREPLAEAMGTRAQVVVADFQDSLCPSWTNVIDGHLAVIHAVQRTPPRLAPDPDTLEPAPFAGPVLMIAPRAWTAVEKSLLVDGKAISAAVLDVAIFLYHNVATLIDRGVTPTLVLRSIEHHTEAALWNELLCAAQETLGLERGTVRVSAVVETVGAAFEMEEILFALREHACGLSFGRWGFLADVVRTLGANPAFMLPERSRLQSDSQALLALRRLLARTCHRRGALAIGGLANQLPSGCEKLEDFRGYSAFQHDKLGEAEDGFDGTQVAHPDLISAARAVIDPVLRGVNQLNRPVRAGQEIAEEQLLCVPPGGVSLDGVRYNITICLVALEAWLSRRGVGTVDVYGMRENGATVDLAASQLRQWVRYAAPVSPGHQRIDTTLARGLLREELGRLRQYAAEGVMAAGQHSHAADVLDRFLCHYDRSESLLDFAYQLV